MRPYIITLLFVMCGLCSLRGAFCQTADTVYAVATRIDTIKPAVASIKNDSIYFSPPVYTIAYDTMPLFKKQAIHLKSDSLHRVKDSLLKKQKALNVQQMKVYAVHDSLAKTHKLFLKNKDSLIKRQKSFNASNAKISFARDSIFKAHKALIVKNDSLVKLNAMRVKKNALLAQKNFARMDSIKRINWKKDSVRIKEHLIEMKHNLQQMQKDSLRNLRQKKTITVLKEIPAQKDANVFIDNLGRKIIIKTSNDNKVRLESSMNAPADFDKKDIDLGLHLNIAIEVKANKIGIKKLQELVKTDPDKNVQPSLKTPVTITIPAKAKLTVRNRYTELAIENDLKTVELDLMNTKLTMKDADKAVIKNRYGSIEAGNIKDAQLDLLNCRLTSGELETLIMKSKYSNISFTKSENAEIQSTSDDYSISRVDYLAISKSFGKLKIDELASSFKLTGNSADVQISKIAADAKLVQLNNKYAEIKLPVENLPNYSIQFDGTGNRLYAPFEIIKTTGADSNAFTKTMGNMKKSFTAFMVTCSSCAVDFR